MKQIFLLSFAISIVVSGIAQDPFSETIISQGKSTVKQVPEIISFSVEFALSNKDYEICANLALGKIDTFKMKLKEKGINEDLIKTASYSIQEITDRDNRTHELIHQGYRARIPIIVKLEVTDPRTNEIFELLNSTFKSEIRISFELSPKQKEKSKENLLTLAVEDAKSKAEILAKSLNIQLGKVIKVQYGDPQVLRNFTGSHNDLRNLQVLTAASSVRRSNITTLTPPEVSMIASVVLAFEIVYN